MHDQHSRPRDGAASPARCPDCRGPVVTPTAGARPYVVHDRFCPTRAAGRDRAHADLAEIAELRAAGLDPVLRRPIDMSELIMIELTMPAPLPRKVRRAIVVIVEEAGPRRLLRTIVYLGVARAAMLTVVPPAVAR